MLEGSAERAENGLFIHTALISAVFIRLIPALLVAPLQSRATK
jgi:hypothetical protein